MIIAFDPESMESECEPVSVLDQQLPLILKGKGLFGVQQVVEPRIVMMRGCRQNGLSETLVTVFTGSQSRRR